MLNIFLYNNPTFCIFIEKCSCNSQQVIFTAKPNPKDKDITPGDLKKLRDKISADKRLGVYRKLVQTFPNRPVYRNEKGYILYYTGRSGKQFWVVGNTVKIDLIPF